MTFPNQSQMYPGHPYPYRKPPPEIPKKYTFWIGIVLFGTLAIVVIGLVLGFWRAAQTPTPVLEGPDLPQPVLPPTEPPEPR